MPCKIHFVISFTIVIIIVKIVITAQKLCDKATAKSVCLDDGNSVVWDLKN